MAFLGVNYCSFNRPNYFIYICENLTGSKTKNTPIVLHQKVLLFPVFEEAFFKFPVILPSVDFDGKP